MLSVFRDYKCVLCVTESTLTPGALWISDIPNVLSLADSPVQLWQTHAYCFFYGLQLQNYFKCYLVLWNQMQVSDFHVPKQLC